MSIADAERRYLSVTGTPLADSYVGYTSSVVASLRLMAATFEEFNESGHTKQAEKQILANPEIVYYRDLTNEDYAKNSFSSAHTGSSCGTDATDCKIVKAGAILLAWAAL